LNCKIVALVEKLVNWNSRTIGICEVVINLKSHHIYVCFYAGVGVAGTVTAGAISGVVGYIAADNDC
jgi:hypothetical protein